jgi:hypothetical protein
MALCIAAGRGWDFIVCSQIAKSKVDITTRLPHCLQAFSNSDASPFSKRSRPLLGDELHGLFHIAVSVIQGL